MNFERFDRALIFAARAHDGQRRKGTDIPYITHPVALAMMLREMDCPDEVIVAALLHDVVEDTPVSLAEVRREFGDAVAGLVEAVSEPDKSAPWEERKRHTIAALRDAPLPVKLLACADKLHNITTLARDHARLGDAVWSRFNRGRAQQAWYYRQLVDSLLHGVESPETYPIFARFARAVHALFDEDG